MLCHDDIFCQVVQKAGQHNFLTIDIVEKTFSTDVSEPFLSLGNTLATFRKNSLSVLKVAKYQV